MPFKRRSPEDLADLAHRWKRNNATQVVELGGGALLYGPEQGPPYLVRCTACGEEMWQERRSKRGTAFCSSRCWQAWRRWRPCLAPDCDQRFRPANRTHVYCSRSCFWKGYRRGRRHYMHPDYVPAVPRTRTRRRGRVRAPITV